MAFVESIIIKDSGGVEADVTAANALKVDGSAVTQPVSGTVAVTGALTDAQLRATPVPVSGTVAVTGVATAANQATEIASLASIDAGIPVALGQTTMANSMPVVIASDQSAVPISGLVSLSPTAKIKIWDGTDEALVTAAGELNVIATAQPGVDIGDVTVNNGILGNAVNIQDGGNSITVDNAALSIIGGGVEATALRVTIANDSTGVLSIDDNGGSLTVDGTVAVSSITTSVTPGTAATNLGKAEDAPHTTGDTGVMLLGVRNDSLATVFTGLDGDYSPIATTSKGEVFIAASSNIPVTDTNSSDILTSLQLIDDTVFTDDTSTHSTGTTKGIGIMAVANPTDAAVDANDIGMVAMTLARAMKNDITTIAGTAPTTVGKLDVKGADGDVFVRQATAGNLNMTEASAASALTSLQLIDDVVATLGTTTYTEATTKGNIIGAVRRDANTTLVDTTNEIAPLQVNATGELKVAQIQALPAGTNNIGDIDVLTLPAITIAAAQTLATVTTVGAVTAITNALPAGTNNIGDVDVLSVIAGTGATNLGKAEGGAHGSGDTGVAMWGVRNDALATTYGADQQYAPIAVNAQGALYLDAGKVEDTAHNTGDSGIFNLAVSNEGGTALVNANLDYTPISVDKMGQLYVNPENNKTLFRGMSGSFRTLGRAGTAGQKIFAIHNATGSSITVKVNKIVVDMWCTVVKAITVAPPIVRIWKFTAVPTNGTVLTKNKIGGKTTSNASATVWNDSSADGSGSGTTLTVTLPGGTILDQKVVPRVITAAGEIATSYMEFVYPNGIQLAELEGVCVFLDYTLATQNPTTDMWVCSAEWDEFTT